MKIICRKHNGLIDVPGPNKLNSLHYRFNGFVFNCPICDHQLVISSIQKDIIIDKMQAKSPVKVGSSW